MAHARVLLGRDEWVEAAIDALADHGIRGLAVEPLARRIGISKGSFYWHFVDLNDLVSAVLAAWRSKAFDGVVERLKDIETPRERLAGLIHIAWDNRRHLRAEAALLSAALEGDRRITRVVKDVTRQRLAYLGTLYRALGLSASQAERWALCAYSAYVGTLQLMALEPKTLADEAAVRAHARHLVTILIPM